MLGRCCRAKIVKTIGSTDKAGNTYPLNYGVIFNTRNAHAYILGIDHPVANFDGRVIAALIPKKRNGRIIWIMAPKSSRYINVDILKYIDMKNFFANYSLKCIYESSSGAIVYRNIDGTVKFLLIKNKRSANWGFPKGHLEQGETKEDAARREVLEETGLHINLLDGFEGVSKYKIRNNIDKTVSIFIGTTEDTVTTIQEEEIDDYIWLPYDEALPYLKFENDRRILNDAVEFLKENSTAKI